MHGNGYREFSLGGDTVVGHKFVSTGDSDVTGIFLKGLMAVGAGDNDFFHAVINEKALHFAEDVLKMFLKAKIVGRLGATVENDTGTGNMTFQIPVEGKGRLGARSSEGASGEKDGLATGGKPIPRVTL